MREKINPTVCITVGIILALIAALLIFNNNRLTKNYEENGIEVDCITVEIINGRKGSQTVTGAYLDKDGNVVTAKVIRNARTDLGEEYKGYVLPDKPGQVYCMPSESMKKTMYLIFYGAGIVGGVLFLVGVIVAIVNSRGSRY